MIRSLMLISATFLFIVAVGCDSTPPMVQVSGVVLIDGKPLTYGQVQIAPANHRPAFAKLDAQGRFTLTTTADGDGVAIGTHPAAVIGSEAKGGSGVFWHAPPFYADISTAGLQVTIDKATKDLKIELSWGTEKPYLEKFKVAKE
ncbi:MAG: hypothetical protein ACRC8S_20760 [Fimbriiglobus sp.]